MDLAPEFIITYWWFWSLWSQIWPGIRHGDYADGTERQTDGYQTVTLRFSIDVAS